MQRLIFASMNSMGSIGFKAKLRIAAFDVYQIDIHLYLIL